MEFKEIKRISTEAVRCLCIMKGWFIKGTNEDYFKLMEMVESMNEESLTPNHLAAIAENILVHSDTAYNIEAIMWELNKVSDTCYVRV